MPEYKGYKVELDHNGDIVCRELDIEGKTWADVTKAIDAETKIEYEKVPALYLDGEKLTSCFVTRAHKTTYGSARVWITIGKKRETIYGKDAYQDTPKNRAALERIIARRRAIDEERLALSQELENLPKATPKRKE